MTHLGALWCLVGLVGPSAGDGELNKRRLADKVLMKHRLCVYTCVCLCGTPVSVRVLF